MSSTGLSKLDLKCIQVFFSAFQMFNRINNLGNNLESRSFEFFSHFTDDLFLVLSVVQSGHTGYSFNTANAGGNTGFRNDLEHTDVAGSLDMGTAAKFAAGADVKNTNLFTVFFSEQHDRVGLLSLVDRHDSGLSRRIAENFFVHDVFDFVDLFTSHRRGVNKVEAGSVAINHGAALLNMGTEHFSQCLVHQVRHGVVAGRRFAVFFIDLSAEEIADFNFAFGDIAHMTKDVSLDLECIVDLEDRCLVLEGALVAHLTAALCIERSTVEHNNNFVTGFGVFDKFAVFVDSFDAAGLNCEGVVT